MERPSHIDFDSQARCLPCRLPYAGLAISLQCAAVFLFLYGIANHRIENIIRDIEVVPIPEKDVHERARPPEPNIRAKAKKETAIEPKFKWEKTTGGTGFPPPPVSSDPPARGLDRALAAVPGTHTVPPYPPIARRMGAEGKVTLRLTVSTEGKVTAAEVVTSSGRDDMDQGARQWIMAHWVYKPALDDGVPVIGHVLATVNFNLINER